jgi:hypothetical protein
MMRGAGPADASPGRKKDRTAAFSTPPSIEACIRIREAMA